MFALQGKKKYYFPYRKTHPLNCPMIYSRGDATTRANMGLYSIASASGNGTPHEHICVQYPAAPFELEFTHPNPRALLFVRSSHLCIVFLFPCSHVTYPYFHSRAHDTRASGFVSRSKLGLPQRNKQGHMPGNITKTKTLVNHSRKLRNKMVTGPSGSHRPKQ